MLGCTHHFLVEELPFDEYSGWINFFERQPPGWQEDLRTYYIMSSMAGSKNKPEEIFPSIAQLKKAEQAAQGAVASSFKASPFFTKMQAAYNKAGKNI